MVNRIAPVDPARVLAVVPTPRFAGFAVVGCFNAGVGFGFGQE